MKTKIEIVPLPKNSHFLKVIPEHLHKTSYELQITSYKDDKNKAMVTSPITPMGDEAIISRIKFGVDFTLEKMQEWKDRKREQRNKTIRGKIINFFTQEIKIRK